MASSNHGNGGGLIATAVEPFDGNTYECIDRMAHELTMGLELLPTATTEAADHVRIEADPPTESTDEPPPASAVEPSPAAAKKLVHALWVVGLLTMAMAASTALYKPARGLFARCALAYYVTLAAIFLAATAELLTASWLSQYAGSEHDGRRRRFSVGRAVLCASIAPFVAVASIGGFDFISG